LHKIELINFLSENYFPTLEEIWVLNVFYYSNGLESFENLYYKQMRKLKFILWLESSNLKIKAELIQISRFVNLEELDLNIDRFQINEIM
jgi:hypothetical protein